MLSDYELEEMQATQEDAMPELVTIERRTLKTNGLGGTSTDAWVAVATDVPARISPSQVLNMGGQGDRNLELEKWNIRMPHGTDLQDRDRIIWGTQTIGVEEVKTPRSFATNVSANGEIVK
jgi:hypothetical protein